LAKKRRKINPNRFQTKDDKGIFSFDPIRRDVFKWGLVAGAVGGFFMLRPEIFWQIIGVFAVVFISNYHIAKAARRIPRWHATIVSFLGVIIALFGVIILGTIILTYLQGREAGG
jgi:hypothetical protein